MIIFFEQVSQTSFWVAFTTISFFFVVVAAFAAPWFEKRFLGKIISTLLNQDLAQKFEKSKNVKGNDFTMVVKGRYFSHWSPV